MAKKKSVSSRPERRLPANALFTAPITDKQRRELRRLATLPDSQIDLSDASAPVPLSAPITDKQRRELRRLATLPDSQIDLSDASEVIPPADEVQIGRFYRPIKQLVSLRVDADVLASLD